MNRRLVATGLLLALATATAATRPETPDYDPTLPAVSSYQIDLSESLSGRLFVTLETPCPPPSCTLEMPVWSATYQVRDFAQYVDRLSVEDASGRLLTAKKIGPSQWTIDGSDAGRVRIRYRVLANRPGPFGAYADGDQVTLNLAQVLAFPPRNRDRGFSLRFTNLPPGFKQAVALPSAAGVYRAPNYDRLVDTPAHLSDFQQARFTIDGKAIRVVAFGRPGGFQLSVLKASAQRIVGAAAGLMGELPFDEYTFVYIFSDLDGGGMEYRNGTLIYGPANCGACSLPNLTAHEFFHLWNVKRIRPASMEPIDYSRPNPSPSLWFAEGVTSAYALYLQIRAGMASSIEMRSHLEQLVNEMESRPAAHLQSAEDSSIEAWFELYPEYGSPDRSVSYYLRGEIIGHLLDLSIRAHTENARSLDDVMRLLNERYGFTGEFYEDSDALKRAVSEVAGADMTAEFDQLVRSAGTLPWDDFLGYAGYRLIAEEDVQPDIGMTLANPAGVGIVVAQVDADGPAAMGGFRVGDRIMHVDGRRMTGGSQEAVRRIEKAVGRSATVTIERNGLIQTLDIAPTKKTRTAYRVVEADDVTELSLTVRRGWSSRTISVPAETAAVQ